jgi:hypothetical protein
MPGAAVATNARNAAIQSSRHAPIDCPVTSSVIPSEFSDRLRATGVRDNDTFGRLS